MGFAEVAGLLGGGEVVFFVEGHMSCMGEYPDTLDAAGALRLLLHSCERLQFDMGGLPATKKCSGLLDKWDTTYPTFYYLERNMRFAREVLGRLSTDGDAPLERARDALREREAEIARLKRELASYNIPQIGDYE